MAALQCGKHSAKSNFDGQCCVFCWSPLQQQPCLAHAVVSLKENESVFFDTVLMLVWTWPKDTNGMFTCLTNQSHKKVLIQEQMVRRSFNGQQYAPSTCVCFMAVCGFVRKDESGWGWLPTDCQNPLSAESSCWLYRLNAFCFYIAFLSTERKREL